jgi:hypothetical protein
VQEAVALRYLEKMLCLALVAAYLCSPVQALLRAAVH